MPEIYLYALDSITSYTGGSNSALFPNSSSGHSSADGQSVTFGNANGEKITVSDNDSSFADGDTLILFGQSSSSAGSLFNLSGAIDPEYSYTLTDPGTGQSFRIYAVTANDLILGNTVVGFASEKVIDPSVNYTIDFDYDFLGLNFDNNPSVPYANLVACFATGTQIETTGGRQVAVEDLRVGDLIQTADHGPSPLLWVGTRAWSLRGDDSDPGQQPIRIAAAALGNGLPAQPLIVSPQHRLLVRSRIAERMFGHTEVLIAAKHLTGCAGIDHATDIETVTYIHLMLPSHEVIFANGAPAESFFAGPQALKDLTPPDRTRVLALFNAPNAAATHIPCRPFIAGRLGRKLCARHNKNQRPLWHARAIRAPKATSAL